MHATLLVLALFVSGSACPDDAVELLHQARLARYESDVAEEKKLLGRVVALEEGGRAEAEATRRLAQIEWLIEAEYDAARERLLGGARGAEAAEAWFELARLELHREGYTAARSAAAKAVELAPHDTLALRGRVLLASAVVSQAAAARREGAPLPDDLPEAVATLGAIVDEHYGVLEPAQAFVRGAALLRDADALRRGWESYYHVDEEGNGPASIEISAVREAFERWPTTAKDTITLVARLSDTRLFDCAELVALDPGADDTVRDDPRVHEIVSYARAIRELRHAVTEYYRGVSLGKRSHAPLDRALREVMKTLAPELAGVDPKRPPDVSQVKAMIGERFGASYSTGRTSGFYGLNYGHIVIDVTRSVEQYGRTGELRFVALDQIVSNGFPGWDEHGGGSTGGWARPGEMWQVRSAYAGRSIEMWMILVDEVARREFLSELEQQAERDELRAREDPLATLASLPRRLAYEAATELYARLVDRGLAGRALRRTFMREIEGAIQDSSIFAHEGRHVIDTGITRSGYPSPNVEFTAKLSEIAFAPQPRLAVRNVFSPSSGASFHAVANEAVRRGFLTWMEEHADEIDGFDPTRPTLVQFGLLTEEQMREASRSMDPLAQGFR